MYRNLTSPFELISSNLPTGDQPKTIDFIVDSLQRGNENQTILGITGSGKTFTMANIIQKTQRPSIIMVHNKTLAAQIYGEMKLLFPKNAVEYFVSYYDYYQPEAYVARTDTYIEKDSSINKQIDLLRHSATRALLERRDVIVVASVSMIYGLGSPDLYQKMTLSLESGGYYSIDKLLLELINLQYKRESMDFTSGTFRIRGSVIDIMPAHYSNKAWRLKFDDNLLESICEIDSLTGDEMAVLDKAIIFANSHFVTPRPILEKAMQQIKIELDERCEWFELQNKPIEANRLRQKVRYDLEMLNSTGQCKGIENYSRHFVDNFSGKPSTLFEYLPKDSLLFIDESHVSIPQIRSMYHGDRARKEMLVEYGFRLPSAFDNRPLKFDEWNAIRPQTIFVSATPNEFELSYSKENVVEMIIRPTGLLDPICEIRPLETQIKDLIKEINKTIAKRYCALVTCLTKKMAEDLTKFLINEGIKAEYIHSDVHTLDRIAIMNKLRSGEIDVLVGINLLREGLDIPECQLVAILDADKEGFLRSKVSLIQTIGRAARNAEGKVILYADVITGSIKYALDETNRRRKLQEEHNIKHNLTPQTIKKDLVIFKELSNAEIKPKLSTVKYSKESFKSEKDLIKTIQKMKREMHKLAKSTKFEQAANLRDQIKELEMMQLSL